MPSKSEDIQKKKKSENIIKTFPKKSRLSVFEEEGNGTQKSKLQNAKERNSG